MQKDNLRQSLLEQHRHLEGYAFRGRRMLDRVRISIKEPVIEESFRSARLANRPLPSDLSQDLSQGR